MAIDIKTQSLFPVRRDKQIPQTVIGNGTSSGGASGGTYDSSIDLAGYLTEASLNIGGWMPDFVWQSGELCINNVLYPIFGGGQAIAESSLGSHFKWISGYLNVSDYISKTQVDASLNNSFNIQSYIDGSIALLASNKGVFVQCSSIGASSAHSVYWKNGYLEASMGAGTGDVTKLYVDGSLSLRDTKISAINASLNDTYTYSSIDPSIASLNAKASSDVTMTSASTWYTGTSLSIPAGTWLIMGTITMGRTTTTAIRYSAKIYSSGYDYASGQQYAPSVNPHYISIALSSIITLSSTTTVYLSGRATTGSCVIKAAIADGASGNNATQLSAIKIKP